MLLGQGRRALEDLEIGKPWVFTQLHFRWFLPLSLAEHLLDADHCGEKDKTKAKGLNLPREEL